MSILTETFQLANGIEIPKIGLGTWQSPPEEAYQATKFALTNGYRHVDTAVAYRNEANVGQAVRDSGIPREEIFVTTKVSASTKTYEEAKALIEQSQKELAIDYIDLILIHAPRPWDLMRENPTGKNFNEENIAVWKALEEAYQGGKVKAIGVSNFSIQDLQNIFDHSEIKPMVNQFVYHIGKTNDELVDFCQKNDVLVEGYSPIATGKLLGNRDIQVIADQYGKSIPQVSIRYLLEKNILPLPKSVHEKYILQNAEVDFHLSEEDIKTLDQLNP